MNELFNILKQRIENLNLGETIIYPLIIITDTKTLENLLNGKEAFWSIQLLNLTPKQRGVGRVTLEYEIEIARYTFFNFNDLNDKFNNLTIIMENLVNEIIKDRTINDKSLISTIDNINFEQTVFLDKYSSITGKLKLKIEVSKYLT